MNRVQRYFKDSAALFVARVVNLVGNLVLIVWVSRTMGVESFGSYSAALALLALFQIGAALGFENLIPREIGRDPSRSGVLFTHSIFVAVVAALGLTAIMAGVSLTFHYTGVTVVSIWIVSAALLPTSLISVVEACLIGHGRAEHISVAYIGEALGRLVVSAVVLRLGGDVPALMVVYAAGRWLACAYLLRKYTTLFGRAAWRIDRSFLKSFVQQSITFSLITVLAALFWNIDVLALSLFQNEYQLGIYNAAYKVVIIWTIIPLSYMTVALPVLSQLRVAQSPRFSDVITTSLRYLLAAALPLALGIAVLGDRIILALYGPDFSDAASALQVLGWMLIPLFLNNVLYRVLISSGRQVWTLRVTLLGLAVNILTCMLLVPRYGAWGAAVGSLVAVSTSFILNTIVVWRLQVPVRPSAAMVRLVAAGVGAAVVSVWLKPYVPWLWNAVMFVGLYAAGAVMIRGFGPGDWALARRLLQRPLPAPHE